MESTLWGGLACRFRRGLLAGGIGIVSVVGCAAPALTPGNDWSHRARDVAAGRLSRATIRETAGQPGPAAVPAPTASLVSRRPSSPWEIRGSRWAADDGAASTMEAPERDPAGPGADEPSDVSEPGVDAAADDEAVEAIDRDPLPGFFDTAKRDLKAMPRVLWDDTKAVYGNPWNLVFLVGAGGASVALRPEVDDDIEDYYDEHHTFKPDWRDAFGAMGNPGTHFAMAGVWWLVGQQLPDTKTYQVGKQMFSALSINGLSTMLLKVAANTESPNGEELAWPSGHTSSTMAMATVLNHAYGPVVGVPMYGVTALVAIERLDSGEHHFSDIVFGAALGWVVAETVMKEHGPEVFGGQVVPYLDPASGNAGVAWVKTLGTGP